MCEYPEQVTALQKTICDLRSHITEQRATIDQLQARVWALEAIIAKDQEACENCRESAE